MIKVYRERGTWFVEDDVYVYQQTSLVEAIKKAWSLRFKEYPPNQIEDILAVSSTALIIAMVLFVAISYPIVMHL